MVRADPKNNNPVPMPVLLQKHEGGCKRIKEIQRSDVLDYYFGNDFDEAML